MKKVDSVILYLIFIALLSIYSLHLWRMGTIQRTLEPDTTPVEWEVIDGDTLLVKYTIRVSKTYQIPTAEQKRKLK